MPQTLDEYNEAVQDGATFMYIKIISKLMELAAEKNKIISFKETCSFLGIIFIKLREDFKNFKVSEL